MVAKKSTSKKKTRAKSDSTKERDEMLIENFVGLQHAMTNLSIKFGILSDNISNLLKVFEEAAKNYMKEDKNGNQELIQKLDSLLDQNKTIARGLVLMDGKLGRASTGNTRPPMPPQRPKPLPSL